MPETVGWARWFAAAVLSFAALLLAPAAIAGWLSAGRLDVAQLPGVVTTGFSEWVSSGAAAPSALLSQAAAFWAVFHVVKALFGVALIVALIPLGNRLWNAYARSESRSRRIMLWFAGIVVSALVPVLLLVVLANVQGAVAPMSSVLTFLAMDSTPGLDAVREQLAAGTMTPVLTALLADFRLSHAILVIGLLVAISGVVLAAVLMWVQRSRTPRGHRRLRRVLLAGGIVVPMLLPALGLVLLANLSTVSDTAPALASFFDGSGL